MTREGLFRVHVVCDHVLFEIPEAVYNRDMLLNIEFAALSGGSTFIAPGTVVDNQVVRWVRRGNSKVYLVIVSYAIAAARAPGLQRAVEANSLPTVLKAFDVVGHGDNGEAIVNVTPLFVTQPPPAFALGFMKHFDMREIDPERSFVESVKAFPKNIGIRFYQTWVADRDELLSRLYEGEEEESVNASLGFVF